MTQEHTYTVEAIWDPQASVWTSRSDIKGLVIETETLDEFEEMVLALGPEMIRDNHLAPAGLSDEKAADLMPTIVWRRPAEAA